MATQDFKDYYQILGVSKNASNQEIKEAYHQLARKYHPDLNPGDRSAENCLKEINEAQEVLSDAENRQEYDRYSDYWQDRTEKEPNSRSDARVFDFGNYGNFGDFINKILDRIGVNQGYKTSKEQTFFYDGIKDGLAGFNELQPEDVESSLSLSLFEAFHGVKQQLLIDDEMIEAHIPRGAKTGSCLKIKGKGKVNSLTKKRGNLYLQIELQPHPLFQFDGDDLVIEIPITPEEAVLGAEIEVPTPYGKVILKVPPQVDSGQFLRLEGKGWYQPNQQPSDLMVKLKIVTSKVMSKTEREYYQKIQQVNTFTPRRSLNNMSL